jgi:hypothetical protein
MKEVFIRGNDERSSEVIKVLENLGGKRDCNSIGTGYYYLYYLDKDNYITSIHESETLGLVMQKYFEELHLPEPIKELPNTWEEWCAKNKSNKFVYIRKDSEIKTFIVAVDEVLDPIQDRNAIKGESRAKAFLALMQLMNLRDEYRQGWKPEYRNESDKYVITCYGTAITGGTFKHYNAILSFQSADIRDKFLKNFKELIEQAKELI